MRRLLIATTVALTACSGTSTLHLALNSDDRVRDCASTLTAS